MSAAVAQEHISTESESDDLMSATKTVTAEVRFDADGNEPRWVSGSAAMDDFIEWFRVRTAAAVWAALFAHRRCGTEQNLYALVGAIWGENQVSYEDQVEEIKELVGGVGEWKAKRQEAERERQEAERERDGLLRLLSTEPALAP